MNSANKTCGRLEQGAFTMAEVLVTVFVLALACVSLYAGFASGFMVVDSTRQDLRATQILTQKVEALRLCSWSSLTNFPISFVEQYDPSGNGNSANGNGNANNGGTIYAGTVSTNVASPIPDSAAYKSNMCLATVTLYWTNYYREQTVVHSRSLQTLVARYGLQNYIWGTVP